MPHASAQVRSIEAIADFRAALAKFIQVARDVIVAAEMSVQQGRDWVEHTQLRYWQGQVDKAERKVQEARADLHRAKISADPEIASGCADQVIALRRAEAKLDANQRQLKIVRRWIMQLEEESREFEPPRRRFADHVEGELPKALAFLNQTEILIDKYLAAGSESPPAASSPALPGGDAARTAETHTEETTPGDSDSTGAAELEDPSLPVSDSSESDHD